MAPVRRSKGIRLYHLIQSTPCKSSLNIFDCIRKTHRRYFILWPPLPFIVHLLCCLGSNPNACIRIWADQRTRGYKMQIYLSIMCPQRIWTVNLLICSPQTAVVIKRGSYTNSSRWLKASFISPIANNTCLARAYTFAIASYTTRAYGKDLEKWHFTVFLEQSALCVCVWLSKLRRTDGERVLVGLVIFCMLTLVLILMLTLMLTLMLILLLNLMLIWCLTNCLVVMVRRLLIPWTLCATVL